jgi:hypothetical protein
MHDDIAAASSGRPGRRPFVTRGRALVYALLLLLAFLLARWLTSQASGA